MVLRFIFKDFRNNPWFFLFFILNFSIGITGFVSIDAFKVSIQKSLKENSKEFLSADLALSARRKLSDSEIQITRDFLKTEQIQNIQEGRLTELFTMATGTSGSRLIQLKAVDESYPFYGKMILKNGKFDQNKKEINNSLKAWVYPELLTQLNLKIGDKLRIGKIDFEIADVILEDSTQTFRLASIAPKVYVGYQAIENTNLIQFGSTLTDVRLYKFTTEKDLAKIKGKLFEKYLDPAIQVSSPSDAEEDSGRALGYLNDYLGLVSLVGLFLAMIGSIYLFRSFLNSRVHTIAILNTLGLDLKKAFLIIVGQFSLTGFFAALLSVLLSTAIIPLIQKIIQDLATSQIQAELQSRSVLTAIIISVFGILLSSLPYLVNVLRIQTSSLLQEAAKYNLPIKTKDYLYFIPLLFFFFGLSILQSNSIKVGSLFFICLMASIFVLYLFSLLFLKVFSIIALNSQMIRRPNFKQALLYINRKRSISIPTILSLSITALLLNLIPQLKVGLLEEFQAEKNSQLPSLFLFDIQDDQITDLKKILASENVNLDNLSPMVRARILSVNGNSFEKTVSGTQVFKTREEESEARFRNRGFNLSYRQYLNPTEKIIEGQFFRAEYNSESNLSPEISVEKKFADRLGFKLKDKLKFDIQGVEIEGVITNFRSVKWNSFQPNFFVLFQSGVLDDSPKSWLGSIKQVDEIKKSALQNKIVDSLPNISIVDIERTVRRVLDLITKMSLALQFMSVLSLSAGAFVIYSISKEQMMTRKWDINLTKILGNSSDNIFKQSIYEALLIGLTSAIIGVAISILLAYILSIYIFGGVFTPNLFWPLVSILVITFVTLLVSTWASRQIVSENPSVILRQND